MDGWLISTIIGLLIVGIVGVGMVVAKDINQTTASSAANDAKASCGSTSCSGSCTASNSCGSDS